MTADWEAVRAQFPALERWTYLNTATFGQMPRRATMAIARHFEHRDELACWDFLNWFDQAECVRESAARLVNCLAADIAFIPNACSGLATLLAGIDWRSGDQIITLRDEFPNQIYAPQMLAKQGVAAIECAWEELRDRITERTRLVAISSVNYNNGFAPPLEELQPWLRERGVLLYVDGTQSVGALRFDIQRIQPDVLAVHGYKWLISPNGAGFLYVRPELRERLAPNVIGWRSHEGWREVDNLHHGAPRMSSRAEKYEGGMISFALVNAMGESLNLMHEIGPTNIEVRVLELADQIRTLLRELGAIVNEDKSQIVAARFQRDASEIAQELKERKILVAARKGNLRVSPHFYNNESDIATLARELRTLL